MIVGLSCMFAAYLAFGFGVVMASVFVTVCFHELLRDVCLCFSLEMPKYGAPAF